MVKGAVLFSLVGKLTACNAGQRWVNDKAFYSDIDNCEACAGVCCNEGWHHFSLHAADKHCWCYGDDARWGHDDSFVGGDCYAEDSKLIATADATDTLSGAPLPTPYREPVVLAGAPLPTPYRDPSVADTTHTLAGAPLPTPYREPVVLAGAPLPTPYRDPSVADATDTLSGAPLPTPYREPLAGAPLPTPYRDPSVADATNALSGAPLPTPYREPVVLAGAPLPTPYRDPSVADTTHTLSGAPLPTPYREPVVLAGAPLPTPYRDPSVGKSATCQYGPLVTHVGEMWVKPGENHTVTHTYYPDDRLHGSSWIKMPAEIFRGPSSKSDMMSFVKTQTTDEDFVMITDAAKFDRTTLEVLESWEVSANDIVTTCHSFNQCTPEGVLQPPSREMVRAAREGVEPVCTFCHGSHTHSATHLNKFFFAHARAADGSLLSVMFIRHGNGDTWVTHVNEVMIVKKHVLHPSTRGATNPFCDVYGKEGVELGPDENNALIAMQPLTQDDVLLV